MKNSFGPIMMIMMLAQGQIDDDDDGDADDDDAMMMIMQMMNVGSLVSVEPFRLSNKTQEGLQSRGTHRQTIRIPTTTKTPTTQGETRPNDHARARKHLRKTELPTCTLETTLRA